MKRFVILAILFFVNLVLINSITANTFTINNHLMGKDNYKLKMSEARIKFNQQDYHGALRIYRELYVNYEDDASLNYRMGECFVAIEEMDTAITYLKKSLELDSLVSNEVYLLLGKSYQYLEKIDKAIENYYKFKLTLSPKQNEKHEVNVFLQQCLTAKEMIVHPANVIITNLGPNINSKYTDACPSITADGITLIFTSRRAENTGRLINPETEEYYDDIYISTWNDTLKIFTKAKNIGSPINTKEHDANMSISPDGTQIFIYKNIAGVTQSGDIYISKKNPDGKWSPARPIVNKYINSSYFESSACITADGNTLYFVSEREKDGYGNSDIYMAKREGKEWGKPVNIGPIINTKYDEIAVFIHPDGKTLFFSSNGHNTMGGYDIFMSKFENGNWSEPVNIGYPINTTKDEYHFVLTTDRKTAYISSSRDGGFGKSDIYKVDMSNYFNKTANQNQLSILKGIITDYQTKEPVETNIEIKDLSDSTKNFTTSNDKGEYFITLPSGKFYELIINNEEYDYFSIKINLPAVKNETLSEKKDIVIKRKQ